MDSVDTGEQQQIAKAKVKHQPAENGECLSCHSPHQSENKKLLSKAVGKLCFECHEDLQQQLAKAKFKHQPVDEGDCASCHAPHATENPKLLSKPVPAACYECHEKKDLEKVKEHAGPAGAECLKCHDPHLGGDEKLLKPAALKGNAPAK